MSTTPRLKLITFCLLLFCNIFSSARAESVPEYYVKAAFLFKILNFVEWPTGSTLADKPAKICVLGKNPFQNYLHEIADTNKTDYVATIHITRDINTADDCHILFISQSEKHNLSDIIPVLKQRPTLTISDIKKFAFRTGMIEVGIHPIKNKFQFKMNLTSVKASGIKISSNLIELATTTYGHSEDREEAQ